MPKNDPAVEAARKIRQKLSRHWRDFRYYTEEQEVESAAIIRSTYAERDRVVREALEAVSSVMGHNHWDSTMQHGAGCDTCIRQRDVMAKVHAALAAMEEK